MTFLSTPQADGVVDTEDTIMWFMWPQTISTAGTIPLVLQIEAYSLGTVFPLSHRTEAVFRLTPPVLDAVFSLTGYVNELSL